MSHTLAQSTLSSLDGTPFHPSGCSLRSGCPANVISVWLPQLFMTWPDQRVTNIKTGSIIGKPFQDKIFVPVDVIYPVVQDYPGYYSSLALEDADSWSRQMRISWTSSIWIAL
ncbi:hypothetical protein JCM33374_g6548 [Metschnikowia sp. JCM 33374]|nr:hypothetical protein JCM33374_g6548 [Metschnikowia sp. JCM 33374]